MLLGGLHKTSLIDYPGNISCILFLSGCNFHCPYCHNPELAKGAAIGPDYLTQAWFLDFLKERKTFLDAVVISGGEPTLQKNLIGLCKEIKQIGYKIKIDTNGSFPHIIKQLIDASLVDYIAMDIKTDPWAYPNVIAEDLEPGIILSAVRLLMSSGIAHEFRTTCVKPFVDKIIIGKIARHIQGAERYCLQHAQDREVLNPGFFEGNDYRCTDAELIEFKTIAERWVKTCIIR
ncbi:MAG: anaerobic ribonucleoside-triphosphate reductase activating protein [Deltaproteobacteria bacterium]|nr:anaerobic ribonucleoside-triphosphate reductase activating protein [Deltaproteobacteria bacterium]MBW1962796.1 anaerobic ribonucleoside-triphosphate reductase activating protein [Deltaproteobacteria bacterium]MBW2151678.1 anaerobic ribonucleoside-triphosphate reductase activating protein [Deltaproteobacteria bacterium]